MHPQYEKRCNTELIQRLFKDGPPAKEELIALLDNNPKIKSKEVVRDPLRGSVSLDIRLHKIHSDQTKGELKNTFTKAEDQEEVMYLQGYIWVEFKIVWNGSEWI